MMSAQENNFGQTPSQTVGPYWHIGLPWADGPDVVAPGTPERITLRITVIEMEGRRIKRVMVKPEVPSDAADASGEVARRD